MIADVITIFPDLVESALAAGVVGRARERGVVDLRVRDLRAFTDDRHRTVDDVPYGGGPGMVMKPEPIWRAVEAITAERGPASAVVLMSPQGRTLTHAMADAMSRLDRLVVICGRYEGVDERVTETLVTHEVSIGDYVLTGGELPALVLLDAVTRLVPGVVGDAGSVEIDSFVRGLLDHPHYTRPAEFRGLKVPEVLLSGNHAAIDSWRREQRIRRTCERRPELMAQADLTDEERRAYVARSTTGADDRTEEE
ncbi:MAG: tRNA (guanosine(37)-N1)-methyltransferase TrmD [Acidobacteria bacterium SCN 69-37]|nr:MAG: tRNA (guanosine(37)-N1)-methyltransferase TrmD [Acidobacteria bacterium SCN 69-37]